MLCVLSLRKALRGCTYDGILRAASAYGEQACRTFASGAEGPPKEALRAVPFRVGASAPHLCAMCQEAWCMRERS
jgi:hypothetical protein